MPLIDDNGDVHLAADSRGDGIGALIFSTGGVERARLKPDGTGTGVFSSSQASVRYRLVSDGVTVTAYDQAGTNLSSGTDGGAVLTAILPAAASNGATIDFRNDGHIFPWGTTPALPAGITNKLLIRGNGSTVQLSSGGPRFLDFNKVADGDTFQNIELADLVVDCNNIGGIGHIVLGGLTGSDAWITKVNLDRIAVRRVKIINVPTGTDSSVTFRGGVMLSVRNNLADTLNTISNITIEDYDQTGGLSGPMIEGVPGSDATANVKVDAVVIDRWRVVRSAAPTAFISGGQDILVGGKGFGGWCSISNGYGYGSPDVGIECDSMGLANISNCVTEDSWNAGFFHTNFKAAQASDIPTINYRGCTAKRTSALNGTYAGWKLATSNSLGVKKVRLRDCSFISTAATIDNGSTSACAALNFGSSTSVEQLILDGFSATVSGFTWDASQAALTWSLLPFTNLSTSIESRVMLRNIALIVSGTRNTGSGSNLITTGGVTTGGNADFTVDGLTWDYTMAGGSNGASRPFFLQGNTMNLWCRRVRFIQITGDTAPMGFRVGNSASLILKQRIVLTEFDFSAGPSGTTEISYQTAGQNTDKIFYHDNIWRTKPVPTTLTGLVTATGLQLKTGYPVMVDFVQGSGSGITVIEISTDGGTTYKTVFSQSSGAMPAGPDFAYGPLSSDALVRVTFTTTQPTINLVPVNP